MKHIYIVRKYILASSIKDVLKKEKTTPVHDIWIDEKSINDFKENITSNNKKPDIGFK